MEANPYASPNAEVAASSEAYEPKIFALSGRIGRIRYLAYSFIINLVFMFVIGVLAAIMIPAMGGAEGGGSPVVGIIMFLLYIPLIVYTFALVRRRLNDINKSGWFALLFLVPLVNIIFGLYLLFKRGDDGENDYGPQAVPNTKLLIFAGLLLPIIGIIGIVAAVAIPAYQGYVERAQQFEMQQ